MYKSTYDNLDRTLQFKRIYEKSRSIQTICNCAMAQGNAYICQNPNTVVFNDDGGTIDWEYDQIFARANEQIKNRIKAAKARRALRLQRIAA